MRLNDVPHNYDRAAKYYDWLTGVVFERLLGLERYRIRTIDLLGDLEGATVLDVGCGTGLNFPFLVSRVREHGTVIGIDYSEGMLKQADRRIRASGWGNVAVMRGDAANLAAVSVPVDAVTSAWCLGIVQDFDAALEWMVEVLCPGGTLSIMDFSRSRPEHGVLRPLFPIYSVLLRLAGIDSAEDLDDASLRTRWQRGRRLLGERLADLREENYLSGAGLILSGRKPLKPSP